MKVFKSWLSCSGALYLIRTLLKDKNPRHNEIFTIIVLSVTLKPQNNEKFCINTDQGILSPGKVIEL